MILETYTRIFVPRERLEATILFYRSLLQGEDTLHFEYPDMGLELAAVSSPHLSVLIVSGSPDRLAPFETTRLTIKVHRLDDYIPLLVAAGSDQLEPIQKTPVGRKTRFRHADGLIVEYIDANH